MTQQIAYLCITRHTPKRPANHEGFPVAEVIRMLVQKRAEGKYKTLGPLPKIQKVRQAPDKEPIVLPKDRANVWKEFAGWIEHLLIFKHPAVIEGQYQNRLLWEGWERSLGERPKRADLYDWQTDKTVLEELRPKYQRLSDKLANAIGRPSMEDFDQLYPNEYDDLGFSDRARRAIRELKAILGETAFN